MTREEIHSFRNHCSLDTRRTGLIMMTLTGETLAILSEKYSDFSFRREKIFTASRIQTLNPEYFFSLMKLRHIYVFWVCLVKRDFSVCVWWEWTFNICTLRKHFLCKFDEARHFLCMFDEKGHFLCVLVKRDSFCVCLVKRDILCEYLVKRVIFM